ncbi:MAG: thiaminase II, partial [Muribaculaceae bacterium]|nr:thiaminase II [Muribaculaceae bacterium]
MKWSEEVLKEVEGIYEDILRLPFVKELTAGTLSKERFLFYIKQDSYYIENYSRVLSHIASRLPEKEWREEFLRFALDGILVENALHASFTEISSSKIDPT